MMVRCHRGYAYHDMLMWHAAAGEEGADSVHSAPAQLCSALAGLCLPEVSHGADNKGQSPDRSRCKAAAAALSALLAFSTSAKVQHLPCVCDLAAEHLFLHRHPEKNTVLMSLQAFALQQGLHLRLLAAANAACEHQTDKRACVARQQRTNVACRVPLRTRRKTIAVPNAFGSAAADASMGHASCQSALASPKPCDSPKQALLRALLLLKHLAVASPSAQVRGASCTATAVKREAHNAATEWTVA